MEAIDNATVRIDIRGGSVLIDAADEPLVRQCKWCISRGRTGGYYARNGSRGTMSRWLMGSPDGMLVDHINGDTLDNRRSNLRICTALQNLQNKRKRKPHSAKFKGVSLSAKPHQTRRWVARIRVSGKSRFLGCFPNQLEAAFAYDNAAVELFGEFAAPNFPERFAARTGRT